MWSQYLFWVRSDAQYTLESCGHNVVGIVLMSCANVLNAIRFPDRTGTIVQRLKYTIAMQEMSILPCPSYNNFYLGDYNSSEKSIYNLIII